MSENRRFKEGKLKVPFWGQKAASLGKKIQIFLKKSLKLSSHLSFFIQHHQGL